MATVNFSVPDDIEARFDADVAITALSLFDAMEVPTHSESEIYTLGIKLGTHLPSG